MRLADFSTNGSIHFICMDWRHISELLEAAAKPECLRKVILFGERSLRQALKEYIEHYHAERNHQGKGNVLLFLRHRAGDCERPVQCRKRLGGLLRYYHQEAA